MGPEGTVKGEVKGLDVEGGEVAGCRKRIVTVVGGSQAGLYDCNHPSLSTT